MISHEKTIAILTCFMEASILDQSWEGSMIFFSIKFESISPKPRNMAMKRPAAARPADAHRQVQGQAKPKLEKPSGSSSSSSTMNRPAAAQPAQGDDVVQSGRKVKRQAEAKAVAKPRLEPPPASSQRSQPREREHLCRGSEALPCVFSIQTSGAAAHYQHGSYQCPWCSDEILQAGLATSKGRGQLSRSLKFFWANNKEIFKQACQRLPNTMKPYLPLQALGFPPAFHSEAAMQRATSTPRGLGRVVASLRKRQKEVDPEAMQKALQAVPEEFQERLLEKLSQEPCQIRQARAREAVASSEEKWNRLLQHRQRLRQPVDVEKEEEKYQEWLAEDRGRLQKKFFPERPKEVKHTGRHWTNPISEDLAASVRDLADNATGLPRAGISETPLCWRTGARLALGTFAQGATAWNHGTSKKWIPVAWQIPASRHAAGAPKMEQLPCPLSGTCPRS